MAGEQTVLFTCGCLNVELRCEAAASRSFHDSELQAVFGGQLTLLQKPQKRVVHEWLIREKSGVLHCFACNTPVYAVQPGQAQHLHQALQALVVPDNLRRNDAWVASIRARPTFSDCFQILVDPEIAKTQLTSIHDNNNKDGSHKEDSLVPGYMEGVRSKASQVMKQMMAERQWQVEEDHRRALDSLRLLQSKCDVQCNTLLKIIEHQETAEERRFSMATTKSCSSSVARSESTESKASLRSGGLSLRERDSSESGGVTSAGTAGLDDDVFEMQFNDEAIYEDGVSAVERAEEALEMRAGGSGNVDSHSDDDEAGSTASQEKMRRSSMDLTHYATSAPIQVPLEPANWATSLRPREHGLEAREPSPARPECIEDIARSMRDISERMVDDHTKIFGDLPRPRLYTNHF